MSQTLLHILESVDPERRQKGRKSRGSNILSAKATMLQMDLPHVRRMIVKLVVMEENGMIGVVRFQQVLESSRPFLCRSLDIVNFDWS